MPSTKPIRHLIFETAVAKRPEYYAVPELEFVYGRSGELPNKQAWTRNNDGLIHNVTLYYGTWGVDLVPVHGL